MNPSLPGLPLQNLKYVHTAAIKIKASFRVLLSSSTAGGISSQVTPIQCREGKNSPMTACLDVQSPQGYKLKSQPSGGDDSQIPNITRNILLTDGTIQIYDFQW